MYEFILNSILVFKNHKLQALNFIPNVRHEPDPFPNLSFLLFVFIRGAYRFITRLDNSWYT